MNLKLIPLGMGQKGGLLSHEIKEYNDNDDNLFLYGFIDDFILKLKDDKTLTHLLDKNFDAITENNIEIINQFIEKDSQFENLEDLSKFLLSLKNIYQLNSAITYKSVILEWNRDGRRFFVKNQIKSDVEKGSFKEFLENAEY